MEKWARWSIYFLKPVSADKGRLDKLLEPESDNRLMPKKLKAHKIKK